MKCNLDEKLYRFHDGDLSSQEGAEFQNHLGKCNFCQKELYEIQEQERQFREVVARVFPSGQMADSVMRRIAQEMPMLYPTPRKSFDWFQWFKFLVPAMALVFGMLVFNNLSQKHVFAVPRSFISIESLRNDCQLNGSHFSKGDQKVSELNKEFDFEGILEFAITRGIAKSPDASCYGDFESVEKLQKITIDGNGKFKLFSDSLVWVSGDAELDFKLTKPIIVKAGNADFEITGTRLKISGSSENDLSVTLIEGTVLWTVANEKKSGILIKGIPLKRKGDSWSYSFTSPSSQPSSLNSSPSNFPETPKYEPGEITGTSVKDNPFEENDVAPDFKNKDMK
ncbi:MAG: hypothetical protein HQM10_05335 [Candidatus Riflebacteria bacterium]|nr:hypothetical protein [Candidatus Riflebacteria bacterium]